MSVEAASIAEDVKPSVDSVVVTESNFIANRISQLEARAKEATEAKAEVATESQVAEEAEKSDGQAAEEVKSDVPEGSEKISKESEAKVLSKIDLEQLSEAELQELANKTRSKAIARFGELTADKKALQQQLATLQAQLNQVQQQKQPILESKPEIPKEIAALTTPEAIQAKHKQAEDVIEWAERVLDDAEHLAATDVAVVVDGKEYSKAQVKEYMRDARKVKEKYLPAQISELQTKAQREALRQQYAARALEELEWAKGDDNDLKKQYEAISKSPAIAKIKESVPEVAPELDYILMHAMNSIHGRKYHALSADAEKQPEKAAVRLTPNAAIKSVAAGNSNDALNRSVRELEKRFESTKSDTVYIALRTKQLQSKRK